MSIILRNSHGFMMDSTQVAASVNDARKRLGFINPIVEMDPSTGALTITGGIGRCVGERERNMYDDSNFYVIHQREDNGQFDEYQFGSTRYAGWDSVVIDATPTVRDAYREHNVALSVAKEAAASAAKEAHRTALVSRLVSIAGQHNVPESNALRLLEAYSGDTLEAVITLLESKRLRSEFRISLRDKVVAWLGEDAPQYPTPLSARQLAYL